jgi:hypothetical protein
MIKQKASTAIPNVKDFGARSAGRLHSHTHLDYHISASDPYDSFHSCNNLSWGSTESYQTASPSSSMEMNPSSPACNIWDSVSSTPQPAASKGADNGNPPSDTVSALKHRIHEVATTQESATADDGMMDMQADSTFPSALEGVTYDPNTTANLGPQGWVYQLDKGERLAIETAVIGAAALDWMPQPNFKNKNLFASKLDGATSNADTIKIMREAIKSHEMDLELFKKYM